MTSATNGQRFVRSSRRAPESTVWFDTCTRDGGDFLGRLWSVFAEAPREIVGGFAYDVEDVETGCVFTASFGATLGTAYGCASESARETVITFDDSLRTTQPIDCEFTSSLLDGGLRRVTIGVRDGRSFERAQPHPPLDAVSSSEECDRIARELGGAYGSDVGWASIFSKLEIPAFILRRGELLDGCRSLGLSESSGPVIERDVASRAGEPIMIETIDVDDEILEQLPTSTRAWLEAHRAACERR